MRTFTGSLGFFSRALSLFGLDGLAGALGRRSTASFSDAGPVGGLPQPFLIALRVGDQLFGNMSDLLFPNASSRAPKGGCGCGQSPSGSTDGWPSGSTDGWPPRATDGWPPAEGSWSAESGFQGPRAAQPDFEGLPHD